MRGRCQIPGAPGVRPRAQKRRRAERTRAGGAYHFVRHDEQVVLLRDRCDLLELVAREDLAHGILRGVHDDHLRPGRHRAAGARKGPGVSVHCVRVRVRGRGKNDLPKLVEIDGPLGAAVLAIVLGRVERHVDRNAAVECDGGQVLVEERLEHDHFIALLEERHEDGVLP